MARRKVKTAAQASSNWKQAMNNPDTARKYKEGVMGVTESPTAAAAKPDAQQRYRDNTALASNSGKNAARLNAVSTTDWQNAAGGRGATNMQNNAASKGGPKMDKVAAFAAPIWQAQRDAAASQPKGAKGDVEAWLNKVRASANAQKQGWANYQK